MTTSTQLIGLIGGSGLYQMQDLRVEEERTVKTPYGDPSDAIMLGTCAGVKIAFLPRHGRKHAVSPSEINYRANIWALKSLGVEQIISVSAVGSMKEAIAPGHMVLVDQFIDRTKDRPSTFYHDGIVAHASFADPICADLAKALATGSDAAKAKVHNGGTYVCIEGPMFSSRAESRVYRSWDVSVIGMTNYQEAKLAREAEICYASIALATDYDCWHEGEADVDAQSVLKVMQQNIANVQRMLVAALPKVPRDRTCGCSQALACAFVKPLADAPAATRERLQPIIAKYLK